MKFNFLTDSRIKTTLLSPIFVGMSAALMLSACGDKGATATSAPVEGRTVYETATDHALGSITAPITVIEYASLTCPHCATWTLSVFPDFQKKYIDTGKVRYVFREFPTPPVDLARAGHLLTNCAPEEKYFDLLHAQFRQQETIRTSSDIKGEFIKLAKSAGMSEADFDACMVNQEQLDKLQAVIVAAANAGVSGTPVFAINGELMQGVFTMEQFDKAFAEVLGEPIPEPSETSDATEKSGH